ILGGETDACPTVSAGCPEETAPTRTCDCPDLPTNDRCYTFIVGLGACDVYTTGVVVGPSPCF
ncbi:MAG: hypothetical protein WC622_16705, partial [Pedobacter sp.]|uniref:hypothetical protein n=1 Tax=Pedobacter sp. TaxID=1411316 RepID=UPI003567162F